MAYSESTYRLGSAFIRFELLIIFLFLVACSPQAIDLLEESACKPPCWNEIIPGVTTREEAQIILPEFEQINTSSIRDAFIETEGRVDNIYWLFSRGTGAYGGRVYFKDGLVTALDLGLRPGSLTLLQAVQLLGQPDSMLGFTEWGDSRRLVIYVLYPEQGVGLLSVDESFPQVNTAVLFEDQQIDYVFFFDPNLFEEIMTDGPVDFLDPGFFDSNIQPWEGFGVSFKIQPYVVGQ